ncbi:hypothetical protein GCM10011613_25970 [Cellvibrio zantedeschiae]|uniref:WW domain-containing protein n=1 Tax=Cellvibrio zantedeschiae TaxID=1237077 RepID=A0ABQ3B9K8_9GAMM|nr:linear amide C-N hydrolase [Cellvibrio zantedeschiae]GGY79810.1 hypothetical protein GCM10011613_25970 [Cellvibrio zantedeschiae]
MKKIRRFCILFVAASSVFLGQVAFACSTFVLHDNVNTIYAHHLDERSAIDALLVINKRGAERTGVTWNQLITGKKDNTFSWIAKWGSITVNLWGLGLPDGGMNEKGLYIQEMSLVASKAPIENRQAIYASSWIQHALDTYETVDQVIASTQQFSVDGMEWHYLVADARGRKAAIEFIDGKAVIHANQEMPVPLMCNDAYAKELELFKSLKPQIQASQVEDRFSKGALTYSNSTKDGATYDRAVQILGSLRQPGTQLTYVFDVNKKQLHYNTSVNTEWKIFNWKTIKFDKGPTLVWDIHEPDKTQWLKPATAETQKIIASKAVTKFQEWVGAERLNTYLASVGGSTSILQEQLSATTHWSKIQQ